LLDLVGEERATGKSLGTDLDQRKLTLPLIHLLRQGPPATSDRLRQVLNSPGNHNREALAPFWQEAGSLDYARQRADQLARQARAELDGLPPSDCRSLLEHLTSQVVHRDS
jgi:octaprenyl-diphosphate synthase